ncbi:MATE family efflux transporter [Arcticibacter eurypsychrophilus]|uniref:oligosaccharide flippase family protein n=1 Tax=Arcticibacter eurypsychrophilus TaxID=1434752 RepID=UPI00084D30EF|nr:oligosaccharide flippase family protein [Arcticibacter eurypsychrophilus]
MSSERIAKNTFFLSVRMFVTMGVSLYTSRIILEILGVNDYGIYNIVGGIVVILGFLSGTLSTASSRFITVALGSGNRLEMKQTFSSILFVNIILSIAILIIGETAGLWVLLNKLQIPVERINAAFWVYQISLATVMLNIISVPYNAVIIAHERMKAFAYMSLFDVICKFILVLLLRYIENFDKLLLYAFSIFIVQILDRIIYGYYCSKNFEESHFTRNFTGPQVTKVFHFIGWAAYGSLVSVGFTQGLNVLLNIFFGPIMNAARGISVLVQNSVLQFTANFQTAINPQIIKSFVSRDFSTTRKLLAVSSKLSFFLLCIIGIPIIIEAKFVLTVWLKHVPDYTVQFVRLMIIISIWSSLANPLRIVNHADGNIKKFQLFECSLLLMIVPISYLVLRQTRIPESVFYVHLIIELIAQAVRMKIVLPKIDMKFTRYIKSIYLRVLPVFLIPVLIGYITKLMLKDNAFSPLFILILTELMIFALIYFIGIDASERMYLKEKVITKLDFKRDKNE